MESSEIHEGGGPAPISYRELVQGEIYYLVVFADESMKVPLMDTLIYLGEEKGNDGESLFLFQEYETYKAGLRIESAEAEDGVFFSAYAANEIKIIFKLEMAVKELERCLSRKKG